MNESEPKRVRAVLIACIGVLVVVVVALGITVATRGSSGSEEAQAPAADNAADDATKDVGQSVTEAPAPRITYRWEHEQSGDEGSASTDIWYPVFATDQDDTTTIDAINADVQKQVQTAQDSLAGWKPWAYVDLYPAITFYNEEYLAIHYYHVYDAGTTGTLSIAGEGGLYHLADGGKNVSPAALLGITEDELLAKTNAAVDASVVRNQAKYSSSVAQMLDEGWAGYVVLQDGVYVYLRGADIDGGAKQTYHLVGVCDFDGNAFEEPPVVDLADKTQLAFYHDLNREEGELGAKQDAPSAAEPAAAEPAATDSSSSESEHEQLRSGALQRGEQVFEGTVRVLDGEELSALSGVPLTANGERGAEAWRNATFVILELDDPQSVSINNRSEMDNFTSEYSSVGLGRNDSPYLDDLPVDTWSKYEGKRICVATPEVGASQGVDIYGPWLYKATLLYEAA